MRIEIAYILGIIAALACTILLFIMVLPEKKRASLPKFFQFLHDFLNFKYLLLEVILKFLYVLATLACIGIGFFMLFSGIDYGYWGMSYQSFALSGLLLMILGPIGVRISYELIMMIILLVRNTMEINRKLPGAKSEANMPVSVKEVDFHSPAAAPVAAPAPTPAAAPETMPAPTPAAAPVATPAPTVYCPYCGTKQSNANNHCTSCGKQLIK